MYLLTPPGVYAPQDDTEFLSEVLRGEPRISGADVLDIGTGSGALAIAAARSGAARVTAVDISNRAVWTARLNAVLHRAPVRVLRGHLLGPVEGRRYDVVLANPPYVPSPAARLPLRGRTRAWEAGRDGRALLDRICADAPPLLRPGGALLMVHSALCGAEPTMERLERAGLRAGVVARRRVPFGPVLRERSSWLVRRGLIGPGETEEELVVVRGERLG